MSGAITTATTQAQSLLPVDPREAMIEGLTEQNDALLETFDKAAQVYQKNQTQQKQTITTLAKSNEQLQAAHIVSEERIKDIELEHKAKMKILEDRMKKLSEENIPLEKFKAKAKSRLGAIVFHSTCLIQDLNRFHETEMFREIKEAAEELKNGEFQ